jgi:hypothetical protein
VPARFCVETAWRDPQATVGPAKCATSALVVWRVLPNRVYHRRLEPSELDWLHQLRVPTTLESLCKRDQGVAPSSLVQRLQLFVHDGIVERVKPVEDQRGTT